MEYQSYLAQQQDKSCPFCTLEKQHLLDEGDEFIVLLARAPYIADHLLIVPKRHIVLFNDFNEKELSELTQLIKKRMQVLRQRYIDINLLLRDGFTGGKIGKSQNHLHFHLIPSMDIMQNTVLEHREYLDNIAYLQATMDFRIQFKC